jgi:glycosyltransferase involved in cell wall biosynthesis
VQALFAGPLARFDYEHVIADNCSTDRTVEILRRLAREDPRLKVILNSRNFGPFRSLYHALLSTSGDAVVPFLPADLQDPPEVIVEFARLWEEGYEVVHGVRAERQENWLMKSVRRLYYRVVNALADVSIPVDVGEFQLIDRVVVDALRPVDDYYPYLRGLIASCGFRSTGVRYEWRERKKGLTKNRLYNLFDQGLNGIISFSNVPMRICLLAGLTLSALSVLYSFYTVVVGLLFYRQLAPPGIPLLIAALFFFSGVQLFFLGVLGEYMSAVHSQVRKRPLVVERGRINFDSNT